jgi:septal ring factor EnvC (AmiA/AmiB activator)
MKTYERRAALLIASAAFGVLLTGCVSSSTYELAKRDAEKAMLLYQNEQHRTQELATANKQLKQQVEALQVTLKDTQEKFERADRDWRETRDELLKLKIEREQQARGRARRGEAERAVLGLPEPAPKSAFESEETKRRLKELMQQLQSVLNQ